MESLKCNCDTDENYSDIFSFYFEKLDLLKNHFKTKDKTFFDLIEFLETNEFDIMKVLKDELEINDE